MKSTLITTVMVLAVIVVFTAGCRHEIKPTQPIAITATPTPSVVGVVNPGYPSAVLPLAAARETKEKHVTVAKADTLWGLAKSYYGSPWLWPVLCWRNQIGNCDLIYPNQVLWCPMEVSAATASTAKGFAYGYGEKPRSRKPKSVKR